MFRHIERLLNLDALLRSGKRYTAQTLAEQLEVSERTIRSDIDFLRVSEALRRNRYHAPIEFNKQQGYHYTDSAWRLPTITLSKGELFV